MKAVAAAVLLLAACATEATPECAEGYAFIRPGCDVGDPTFAHEVVEEGCYLPCDLSNLECPDGLECRSIWIWPAGGDSCGWEIPHCVPPLDE